MSVFHQSSDTPALSIDPGMDLSEQELPQDKIDGNSIIIVSGGPDQAVEIIRNDLIGPESPNCDGPVVVIDTTAESFLATAKLRAGLVNTAGDHRNIYLIDAFGIAEDAARKQLGISLSEMEGVHVAQFNPLDFVSSDEILDLIDAGKEVPAEDPRSMYSQVAASLADYLLELGIRYALESNLAEERTFSFVDDLLCRSHQELDVFLEELVKKSDVRDLRLVKLASQILSLSEAERDLVYVAALKFLSPFEFEEICAMTDRSTFSLSEVARGDCDVYFIVPPDVVQAVTPLVQIFIRMLVKTANCLADGPGEQVTVIINQAPSFGHLKDVVTVFQVGQFSNVSFMLITPSMDALKQAYSQIEYRALVKNASQIVTS